MTSAQLQDRLKQFAYSIIPVCKKLPNEKISEIIRLQLIRSAFSAAANYRASCKAQSRKSFKSKLSISFEEIDESLFWLEAIKDLKLISEQYLYSELKEADELSRILAASRITMQKKENCQNLKS
jgi:four helix bundle protein